ncbi:MAG: nucleotide sugar dehydrogenase [Chloroflexi bacterium]|nr:nucleotide sugar dehydrogenase [Chloroflexota bacterium]
MAIQQHAPALALERKLSERTARVGVLGLGYAGLPMAVEIAEAGYPVVGLDVNPARVNAVNGGTSPVSDVTDATIRGLLDAGRLRATSDFDALEGCDVVLICVPTPLKDDKQPDFRFVEAAARDIAARLHPGMLVILQSTVSPGTTREAVLSRLATTSMTVGEDYFVVFAPERIDPGNARFNVQNTPKLVGGVTPRCAELAVLLYQGFVDVVVPVSSPEVAEMSKLVENTFRFINISFVNEIAQLCDRLGISVWEVIDAAATKPFAFMPHYPGAGVGGHCIPIVPFYLEAIAQRHGVMAAMIEAAGRINDHMPTFAVEKLGRLLSERGTDGKNGTRPTVLVLGVTYKRDVADLRESSALEVLRRLAENGYEVQYHDPLVPSLREPLPLESVPLTAETLRHVEGVILCAPHTSVDYDLIVANAPVVLDTCNALKQYPRTNVVAL